MRARKFAVPSPAMAIAFVALLVASGGLALAASPSSPVVRACANKRSGALRLASKCRRGERSTSWNQTGVQGPAGLAGAAGTAGTAGPQGPKGETGPAGSAIAYAHITKAGALDAAHSKNITSVTKDITAEGVSCITVGSLPNSAAGGMDLSAGARGELYTVVAGQDPLGIIAAEIAGGRCPSGTNAITVSANSAGTNAEVPFWIQFD
jgi:hypothetical protein